MLSAQASLPITASLAQSKNAYQSGTNDPLAGPLAPGDSFDYQLSAGCSGLTQGCIGATTVDVIPAGINIQVPPSVPPLYTTAYDAATRTLTITYTDRLASPPNPAGSIGIDAGNTRVATIHATVSPGISVPPGTQIPNTANASADNTAPAQGTATVTVTVPSQVKPVATKSISPSSLVGQSQATTTATLRIRNASTGSAEVSSLTVADTTANTWDDFNLTSVGPVGTFPAGADQVSVQYCTSPAPCAANQFIPGPFTPGPQLSLPAGVDPTTITGIQFVFDNSAGTPLPSSPTAGQVQIGLQLRNTVRSTGAVLDPTRPLTQSNCATPSAVAPPGGSVPGTNACASYTVLPGRAGIDVSKQFFPDASGSFTNNGYAVAGQSSGVSALSTGTNASAFPVTNLTLTDPSATSPDNFNAIDATSVRLRFPSGSTAATGTVTCRDGTIVPFSATPATASFPTGCPAASPAAKVTVTFTGTIAAGASAQLGVHGTLNSLATSGSTLTDCTDGSIVGGTQGGATGTGCAPLLVEAPRTTVDGTKAVSNPSTGGELVEGQPLNFVVQASNTGNLPQNQFVLTDPSPNSTHPNPFDVVQLTSASLSTNPPGLAGQFAIEVFSAGTWQPYDPTNAALLASATGIRGRLTTGLVQPTNNVRLSFTVVTRPGVAPPTSITNCQLTTVTSGVGANNSGDQCAPNLTVALPRSAGNVGKLIQPSSVSAALPGVTPQTTQVRLQAQNTGNLPMSRIVIVDPDPSQKAAGGFFDAVNLVGLSGVNFPPGADRVEVDACTSAAACAAGTYVNGVPSSTPTLPAGVTPDTVAGLRFIFTNSGAGPNDFLLNPGPNFPNNGPCPSATVCFNVAARQFLRSSPTTPVPVPDSLTDVATAGGVTAISNGQLVSFGSAPAPLTITPGTIQLGTQKTAVPTSLSPGVPAGYSLTTTNTGTGAVPALVVTDPIPPGLVFNSTFAGDNGLPFTVTSSVPAGTPPVPAPTYTPVIDPVTHLVTSITWQFPADFDFLPGSSVTIGYQASLAPGTTGGTRVTNIFGSSTTDTPSRSRLTCASGTPDPTLGCTASAAVTAQSGSDIDAQKWIHGTDSRGFYNTRTNTFVNIGDPSCPLLTVGTDNYTRYPCIALTLAGQNFNFLLNLTNVGTTPATQSRIVDDLPRIGDQGVIVPEARGTEWVPTIAAAPFIPPGSPGAVSLAYTDTAPGCITDLSTPPNPCPAGDWNPAFSTSAQAFRAFVDFATPLQPGQSTRIIVPMSAPANPDTTGQLPIAWNSFAHSDFFRQTNGSITQLQAVEPIKVGIALPYGNLHITKEVTGFPLGSPTFEVSYTCVVTTAGEDHVTVAQSTGPFSPAEPLIVTHVPAGAVCTIEETNSGGATAPSPITVTIKPDADPAVPSPTVATVTNDFPAAPAITLVKQVNGNHEPTAPGPYVPVGDTVRFSYIVTNTGNLILTPVTVNDDVLGPISCPDTRLLPRTSETCKVTGPAVAGQKTNTATATGQGVDSTGAPIGPPVTAKDEGNYFGYAPAITVVKQVNGQHEPTPPGLYVPVGDPVTFTYVVKNTGNVTLNPVTLTDDVLGPITCPETPLAPGASEPCAALAAVHAVAGDHANTATATGQGVDNTGKPLGPPVDATDTANYFGSVPSIALVKLVNGHHEPAAPGLYIPVGDPVTFSYVVTNTGNVPLDPVSVTDNVLGAITCPVATLDPGVSETCTAKSPAAAGDKTNTATATGQPPVGPSIETTDTANYYGSAPAITVVKQVNGQHQPASPGLSLPPGQPVAYTYIVTNTGNVTLTGVAVNDNVLGKITCPAATLAPGASLTCTASGGSSAPGSHQNTATATGQGVDNAGKPVGSPVDGTDDAWYTSGSFPTTTTTAPPNTSSPSTSPETSPPITNPSSSGGNGGSGGGLAFTGANVLGTLAGAVLVILAGLGIVLIGRRPRGQHWHT